MIYSAETLVFVREITDRQTDRQTEENILKFKVHSRAYEECSILELPSCSLVKMYKCFGIIICSYLGYKNFTP